jgi:carbohydrate kinase (thermoresistant glucokinase family)
MVFIIFGVSGSGKSTIGKVLSNKLGVPFYDADDFHSKYSIVKMTNGFHLRDCDRVSWLKTLSEKINEWSHDGGAVLACSALKKKYRAILSGGHSSGITFIFLKIKKNVAASRLKERSDHFFPILLLEDQFNILEESVSAITVDATSEIQQITEYIYNQIIK